MPCTRCSTTALGGMMSGVAEGVGDEVGSTVGGVTGVEVGSRVGAEVSVGAGASVGVAVAVTSGATVSRGRTVTVGVGTLAMISSPFPLGKPKMTSSAISSMTTAAPMAAGRRQPENQVPSREVNASSVIRERVARCPAPVARAISARWACSMRSMAARWTSLGRALISLSVRATSLSARSSSSVTGDSVSWPRNTASSSSDRACALSCSLIKSRLRQVAGGAFAMPVGYRRSPFVRSCRAPARSRGC